ncbi:helix-turn-helix domain-containing protein [Clostridium sp. Marseille-P2415]|uniref:helix-turn-helix domain-containing protein n=1 Tax=Clostridium sp. Marseille-P2415 TaxID=1805471 RepID=UPI0009885E0C|nr:helix-turn-helix domain-containing protein [Clostridium sp. Marseille-P2415]
MRIKKIISSLTYEKQMFMRLLGLVTLPLIVMGIVSCNIYIKGETSKNQMALNSYSDEVSREYENILSSLKEYYIEAANGDAVRWMGRQEEPPFSTFSNLKQAQRIMEGNYFMAKYIADYEFINVNYGWVFNNYGMFRFEQMKNREEAQRFLEEQEKMLLSVYWLNRPEAVTPMSGSMRATNTIDTSGLRLVVKKERGIDGISWLLTIKIDENELKEMSQTYKTMGYDVAIISRGKVLMETGPGMAELYLNSNREGSGVYKGENGTKYHISVRTEDISGLTYLVGYNAAEVKKDAIVFIFASFAVLAGFALILFAVRLTAVAFAKPLRRLEKFVDDQDQQIKKLLVSNLIEGELNVKNIEDALKKSEIVPWPAYRMIAMNCKTDQPDYAAILSDLPEGLKKDIFIAPVYYRDKLIFITGAADDTDVDSRTALLYKGLKDHIAKTYGFATASGISQPFHKLHHVRRAYSECTEALYNKSNQADMNNSSLVLFDDFLIRGPVGNVYDMIMENELIQAIISCKEEESACLLELIIDRMERKNVVGIERNFYWNRLLTAMLNIPAAADIPLSDVFDSEQYNVLNSVTRIYDKKKVVAAVSGEIIHPIIATLVKKRQEGEESEVVKHMVALIKDSKGNMSLNDCADQLSYHPNYLSKILKREKGVTFTDMANEEKLKQAKYMLLTTEYSVAEISEKLMYNNVQNFIRFFKNHVGFTPAAFRKEHRK